MITTVPDDRLRLRVAARELVLRRALSEGHIVEAARAAGRARVDGASLSGRTLLESRAIRSRFGRSLRMARRRRAFPSETTLSPLPLAGDAIATASPNSRRKVIAAAVAAVALLVTLVLLARPQATEAAGGGGTPPASRVSLAEVSRGMTITLPAVVPVAVESAEPEPSPEPAPEPVAVVSVAPATVGAGSRATGGTGTGSGGFGNGSGSGVGSGSGRGVSTPAPVPTPAPTPVPTPVPTPAPAVGQNAVLTIIVVDESGRPLPGTCLIIGTGACTASRPRTDANGAWSTTVPIQTPTLVFDIQFVKPGYKTNYGGFTLRQGQTTSYTVRLYPDGG